MEYRFSVLISVYRKEKPEYFSEALASVIDQTLKPNEIVVVKDGPLTEGLEEVLTKYEAANPELFKIVSLETNQGLGAALAKGVEECSYELIARMDSDDISRSDRFEKQIAEFKNDSCLDICGSQIVDFEGNIDNIVAHRRVPLLDAEIKRYQKKRFAFNHPSIMFKKSSVLKAGNYPPLRKMQDGLLYVALFLSGAKGMNLPDYLVYFRVGDDLYRRRGGIEYYRGVWQAGRMMKRVGYISGNNCFVFIASRFVVGILPMKVRSFLYRKILHR